MKDKIINSLSITNLSKQEIENLIEVPKDSSLGDFAFPCFILAKSLKKNPVQIAQDLSSKINSKDFEKVQATGPYINFFLKKGNLANEVLSRISKEKGRYGSSKEGKGKKIVIDLSAPNIAKPFGIGHLRSTIIGNSISNISQYLGYKTIKINYLGDWGTQFGKLIVGYNKWGSEKLLKKDPIKHLQELYVKVNADESLEDDARKEFKKLEDGDKKNLILWKKFKDLSLNEFNDIYKMLDIKFDIISRESLYNNKMDATIKEMEKKGIIKEDKGAQIVDLEQYNLGISLIKKSDGATLYATRDITAAIDRHNKYKFDRMIYEVGAEQRLHFKQFFKILELLGYQWAKNCVHVAHGLYLDEDGKKFATRKGKTVYMRDILNETIDLAKQEISKREKLNSKDLDSRAKSIALAAILYGDLKSYREHDTIFDIDKFISFEGNTGPYLLYTYARSNSIIAKKKVPIKFKIPNTLSDSEKALITKLSEFPDIVQKAYQDLAPNYIANYAHSLSQVFNEFYHNNKVIGTEEESFRLNLVKATMQVLENALSLLGIKAIKKM